MAINAHLGEMVKFLYKFRYVFSGQTGGGLQYARTYPTQCFGGHQQIGRNMRQGSPLDDFGLMFHELVIALACSLKPPGVSLYL